MDHQAADGFGAEPRVALQMIAAKRAADRRGRARVPRRLEEPPRGVQDRRQQRQVVELDRRSALGVVPPSITMSGLIGQPLWFLSGHGRDVRAGRA